MPTAAASARDLRRLTCDLLLAVGPEAPTLCEGWTCADLAAHLVIRECRPDAAIGLVIPAAAARTARIQSGYARWDYRALVERVRNGPPLWSPLYWMQGAANLIEFAVHYEDIRLANPNSGAALPAAIQELVWRRLRGGARLMFRNVPTALTLRTDDGRTLVVRAQAKKHTDGLGRVVITGTPVQLLLEATGRKSGAVIEADATAGDAYQRASRGI